MLQRSFSHTLIKGLRCVDCYAYYGKCCKNVDSGCSPSSRRELAIDSPNEGSSFEKDVVSKAIQANEVFNNYRKLTTEVTCSQEIHESNLFFMRYLLTKSVKYDPEWTSGCSCWLLASRHEGCYEACPEGYHRDPKNHEYCVKETCDYNNLFECPENCQRKPDQDCYVRYSCSLVEQYPMRSSHSPLSLVSCNIQETIDNCDCPE